MAQLRTTYLPSLDSIDEEVLEEITADGHTFARSSWYRLLDQLDLPALIGGRPQLYYAAVSAEGKHVCVCPILRAQGEGIYFLYSLRRYFFQHWIEEAARLNPNQQELFARVFRLVSGYRKFLEWSGSPLDECLIVASPLCYRCHIPVAPSSPVPREAIYRTLFTELHRHARKLKLPLWILGVEGSDERLTRALEESGCKSSYLFADNRIDLSDFDDFDDYLQSFRRTTRRAFQRDMQRSEQAGVELRIIDDFTDYSETFTELYENTYRKYGKSFFAQPPGFWDTLKQSLGSSVEAIVALHQERLVGFNILLHNQRRGELWTYRIGRADPSSLADVPYYFGLSFYGPIQRAIELGYRRIWLGPASYETKRVRGARLVPIYNYFWFPRRWDRWFLLPYLRMFGQVSKDQISNALEQPKRIPKNQQCSQPRKE